MLCLSPLFSTAQVAAVAREHAAGNCLPLGLSRIKSLLLVNTPICSVCNTAVVAVNPEQSGHCKSHSVCSLSLPNMPHNTQTMSCHCLPIVLTGTQGPLKEWTCILVIHQVMQSADVVTGQQSANYLVQQLREGCLWDCSLLAGKEADFAGQGTSC